ncbi:prolipoprotein diacylglyceryl transferase [Micromonospora pattaloongensis]|uniref:prolipoprotein diacylglyceryl transferase n=1 Tax=Micromonospora pattaloongensis TaxID=405436 RepID=UPI000A72F80F|nr:prolipoprotein diacylglyceryl transferase [Micromonospora pattaloongensis]
MTVAAIPSPTTAVWHLGPVPIRAYALCIVLGIVVACVVTDARLRRRGAPPGAVLDIAVWAVPLGIVGARIYHVITSPQQYFGADGHPLGAFKIWEGGLGIWGAVAGGAVGAWLAARQLGLPFAMVADALAPGLPLAQAVGRFGNWFNNELFGGPTTLPWGLEVHRMAGGRAVRDLEGNPITEPGLYHPTFAYEALWNIGVAVLVFAADRRWKLGRGRAFALYVMGYTAGRFWIELMRTDPANEILGLRVNVWTAVLVFLGALLYFVRVRGPQEFLVPVGATPVGGAPAGADAAPASGVSQVDVSATARPVAPPQGYRVVDEPTYRRYQQTGELPDDDDDALTDDGELLDDFADDEPDDDEIDPPVVEDAKTARAGNAPSAGEGAQRPAARGVEDR